MSQSLPPLSFHLTLADVPSLTERHACAQLLEDLRRIPWHQGKVLTAREVDLCKMALAAFAQVRP